MLDTANSSKLMGRPRITITVSEDVYGYLSEWADREERPLANLAAYLLSQAAREHQQQNESSSLKKDKGVA
jgi:macrodomain Ter protein organizer (MatP/YcbG family)